MIILVSKKNTFYTLMLKALTVLLLSIIGIFALLIIGIFVLLICLGGDEDNTFDQEIKFCNLLIIELITSLRKTYVLSMETPTEGDDIGADSPNYTGIIPQTVIGPAQPNENQEGDSDMETQADDYSFEPSSKTPGLTDGTGASGASHGENQMMLELKLSEIEANNERAKQYAEDFNTSHREAYDHLYNSREGKQTDPNTRRADITRVG